MSELDQERILTVKGPAGQRPRHGGCQKVAGALVHPYALSPNWSQRHKIYPVVERDQLTSLLEDSLRRMHLTDLQRRPLTAFVQNGGRRTHVGGGTRLPGGKIQFTREDSNHAEAFWHRHFAMNEILNTTLTLGHHTLTVLELLESLMVFLVLAHCGGGHASSCVREAQRNSGMDEGKQFIVRRLVTSVVWALAAMVALSVLGVDLTALWAGSAALLVGVGIGLQGFFNDVISGFVLLFEGGVAVGNVLEVDGKLVRVERIDLRSTRVVTVAGELIVLPNSKVAGEAVVNLTQGDSAMRIRVNVGVAYGSDVDLVMRLLSRGHGRAARSAFHPSTRGVLPRVCRLLLDFSVMGWLDDPWDRMGIQSRVRTAIDAKFRAHGVTIPFPQRDLHLPPRSPGRLSVFENSAGMARKCMFSEVRPRNVFWTKVNTKSISFIRRTSSNRSPMPKPMASNRP